MLGRGPSWCEVELVEIALISTAAAAVLYWLLVGIVVWVGLKTDEPERRKAALTILRILKPSSKRLTLARKTGRGSS